MVERRKALFLILLNFGRLNSHNNSGNLSTNKRTGLIENVDGKCDLLISSSFARARERADTIETAQLQEGNSWNNPSLNNPYSSAAIEARKYVAVVMMYKQMDIDITSQLDTLSDKATFPSVKLMTDSYPYIATCIFDIQEFSERALSIANTLC